MVVDREDKDTLYVTYCLYVGRYLQGDDEDLWGYEGQTERRHRLCLGDKGFFLQNLSKATIGTVINL